MRNAKSDSHIVFGVYRELDRPIRLVFTWAWEGVSATETLVTVKCHLSGSGTEVVLTHTRFPTEADRYEHLKGWTGCIDRLSTALSVN